MGRTLRYVTLICSAIIVASLPAAAQLPSNSTLKGSYWVRYLGVNGNLVQSFAGTMNFDGNGSFTVSGNGYFFQGLTQALPISGSGAYAVYSSGMFAINNPFVQDSVYLFGGVGVNGIAVGSSSDSGDAGGVPQEDIFVAIPQSTNASAATLNGTYRVAGLEFAGGSLAAMRNPFFNITADGNGNLGNVSVSGTSMALNNVLTTQTSPGATYTMTAPGDGTMTFPAPSGVSAANQLLSGSKNLYVSPDGSFFISGSPTGYDMQVGVKAIATGAAALLSGVYFTSTVENDNNALVAYQGAVKELPSIQEEIYHWRGNFWGNTASDYTFSDTFSPNDDGTASGSTYLFAEGGGGNYAIQAGTDGYYFLTVNVQVPPYTGTGVFLNPAGVVNAGSSAPFTAQVSPGEVITLYGSGFTSSATPVTASVPVPTILGGVQVTVNGVLAPVYYVSSGQINAIVPYTTASDGSLLNIQVFSNGAPSNMVEVYSGVDSPGVFAITHTDGQTLVTSSNPAKVGEILVGYLCGLGAANPAAVAGTISSVDTLAHPITLTLFDENGGATQATIVYQGLNPFGPAGLYQVNFVVPTGMSLNATGVTMSTMDILASSSDYAENTQALVPVSH